jgi:hypothetical protein
VDDVDSQIVSASGLQETSLSIADTQVIRTLGMLQCWHLGTKRPLNRPSSSGFPNLLRMDKYHATWKGWPSGISSPNIIVC